MAATTGKNKVERWFRIWIDDSGGTPRDLSGDLVPGSIGGGGLKYDEADMTGVSEAVYNYLAGHAMSEIPCRFHVNNTATTGSSVVLNGVNGTVVTVTMQWGSGATPEAGDLEWEGEFIVLDATVALDGNKFVFQVSLKPSGSTAPAWGTYS